MYPWISIAHGNLVYPSIEETPIDPSLESIAEQEQEISKETIINEEALANIQEPEVVHMEEVLPKVRIPFQKRRLNLSIYTFDESPMEPLIEDKAHDTSSSNHEECLSNFNGCNFSKEEDDLQDDESKTKDGMDFSLRPIIKA